MIQENKSKVAVLVIIAFGAVSLIYGLVPIKSDQPEEDNQQVEADWKSEVENKKYQKATFAGGCFWCTEAVFEDKRGVAAVISGYAGGKESTATYDQVKTGETSHREAVRIRYYPSVVSYEELLDSYWKSIDPTDEGGQFVDRGYQYTTAIYAHNERQYRLAKKSKENLSESGKFDEPIVTEIKNFSTFFRAEDQHQNYSEKRSASYNIYKEASGRKGYLEKFWEDHPFK